MKRPRRILLPLALLLLGGAVFLPAPAAAKGSLSKVEDEFEKAIQRVTPATVVCRPWGVEARKIRTGTSGVVMSRKGLVLSDGDVGLYFDIPKGEKFKTEHIKRADLIEVRLPNLKGKGFRSYKATVIKRDKDLDTTLMRMEKPPGGLKYLKAGNSDALKVGDFAFAMGNSFGHAAEAPPTLTAGVIASLPPKGTETGGRYRYIYTSAAVNPGVNGGPLVDIHGHLVGTISNSVPLVGSGKPQDAPELAYAYMGKVIPVERLKHHYADLDEFAELFPEPKAAEPKGGETSALATVFHHTARKAYRSVVSFKVKRKGQLSLAEPAGRGKLVNIPRYLGPVSGVLVSRDGYILTSLYNVANTATLVHGQRWATAPDTVKVKACLEGIEKITVYMPDGKAAPATLVSHHQGLGLVLLKAELKPASAGETMTSHETMQPADVAEMKAGRFVLAIGNPFGAKRLDDPLLTVGLLSKRHVTGSEHPWASQWQTDAGVTDANCGGAAVDLQGRLMGVVTLWSATQHGRNSGIGFVIPWSEIQLVLPEMMRGRSYKPPFFGITWKQLGTELTTVLDKILEGKAAEKAGLKSGDEIVKINGDAVSTPGDVRNLLRGTWSGDTLLLTIRRGGKEQDVKITLGARE